MESICYWNSREQKFTQSINNDDRINQSFLNANSECDYDDDVDDDGDDDDGDDDDDPLPRISYQFSITT